MTNTTPVLNLNTAQLAELTRLQTSGQYPTMYRYLKTQVDAAVNSEPAGSARRQDLGILSNWLQNAADINANNGSFKSEFVRAAVDAYSLQTNGVGISNAKFQDASNKLANDVYRSISREGGILSAQEIINVDVKSAVDYLELKNQWGWAGTLGDRLPVWLGGLGQDMVQIDTGLSLPSYLAELTKVGLSNLYGGNTAVAKSVAKQFIQWVGSEQAYFNSSSAVYSQPTAQQLAPDGVTPLFKQVITPVGTTSKLHTTWIKDSNGNYQKVEYTETLKSNGAWSVNSLIVGQYNSNGSPVKASQYNFDSNGNTTSTKALVPTAGGSWVDAPKGAPTSPIEKVVGQTFTYQTTTLAGTSNAGMFTATEVTNTKTGQVDYIIRHNGTGEAIASGSNYVVNANDTITTTSGGTQFTHALSDGRMRVMQSVDGSGMVVGQNGNDFYFDAGSSVQHKPNGSIVIKSPQVGGSYTESTYSNQALQSVVRITSAVGGNPIAGFSAISTSSNGSNWSAPTYTFTNANAASEADYAAWAGLSNGTVSRNDFANIVNASRDYLVLPNPVGGGSSVNYTPAPWALPTAPVNYTPAPWAPPTKPNYFDPLPIGAFYDSQSTAFDNAASVARSTARAMNTSGQAPLASANCSSWQRAA